MLQDYNVSTAQMWGYTENSSIEHKRDMFMGRSTNTDLDNQLFYGAPGAWNAGDVTEDRVAKNVQIQTPLYSGVLGPDSKVFPLLATQGLRVQMTLETLERSCVERSTFGTFANSAQLEQAILGATGLTPLAKQSKVAITDEFSCILTGVGFSPTQGIDDAVGKNNNPFCIGDALYVSQSDGTGESQLGVITKFAGTGAKLQISYIPNRTVNTDLGTDYASANTAPPATVPCRVYYKLEDRTKVTTYAQVGDGPSAGPHPAISWTISDLEMIVSQVQPPQSYVERLLAQIQSPQGMSMDFRTDTLYRFNLTSLNGLTDQFIPAGQKRAYSILSVPLDQDGQNNLLISSFQGLTDGCQNYQYVHGGSLIPDRRVELDRYNGAIPRTDALHVLELEKALVNMNLQVRQLQNIPKRFLLGRGLSKYGQVYDLGDGDLSLRVEYRNAEKAKMYEHFVNHLRRMTITSTGIIVSM